MAAARLVTGKADAAVAASWGGYVGSHLLQFNAWLQLVALIFSIIASAAVIMYHLRRE